MYKRLKYYEGNGKGLFTGLLSKKEHTKKQNNEKYAEDALKHGAVLISESVEPRKIPSQYKSYQLACGHISEHKYTHVRAGLFRCQKCKQDKYTSEAKAAGLVIIDGNPTNDADYKLYKYLDCGHEKLLTSYNVANLKHGVCLICEEKRRYAEAERNGLELLNLEDASKWMHRDYKFISCGHTQSILLSRVTNNTVPSCRICNELKWFKEAKDEGLEFLGVSRKKENVTLYNYRLPCGCIKPMTTGTVRLGVWACNNHSNYYCKPSNVYLFEFVAEGFSWLKLGLSSKLERRIGDYKMKVPYNCTKLYVVPTKSNREAVIYEKALHASHKSSKLDYLSMKEFMTNGGNECYPMSMKDYFIYTLMDFERELNGNS